MIAQGKDISEAWEKSILLLLEHGDFIPTERGKSALEINNINIIVEKPNSKTDITDKYIFSEKFVINYCESLMNSYGRSDSINQRLYDYKNSKLNQIDKIVKILENNYFSRRAIITIWDPTDDLLSLHPPCICTLAFFIRGNKLNLTSVLRSNDAWLAALPDIYSLVSIQEKIANHFKIKVGYYYQLSISYHIYDYDLSMAKQIFCRGGL